MELLEQCEDLERELDGARRLHPGASASMSARSVALSPIHPSYARGAGHAAEDARRAAPRGAMRRVASGARVGFVPTMGALHDGHLALVREAAKEAPRSWWSRSSSTPRSSSPNEDFARYPRGLDGDTRKLTPLGVLGHLRPRRQPPCLPPRRDRRACARRGPRRGRSAEPLSSRSLRGGR